MKEAERVSGTCAALIEGGGGGGGKEEEEEGRLRTAREL